jgi:hypothetical protein
MESLEEWITDRRDNCIRIAKTKVREDRQGWLEDAARFEQVLQVLGKLNVSAEMILRGYKAETR